MTDKAPHAPSPEQIERARATILEQSRELPFFKLIGLEILEIEPCWSKVQIQFRPDLCQPAQIMHGGIIATLIDTGIAHALLLTPAFLHSEDSSLVSVDLRVKFLRPVSEGMIVCESKIPRLGKQIIHAESLVTNAEGKEVARGDSIYMVVKRERLRRGV